MTRPTQQQLLEKKVHLGHLSSRRDPSFKYLFMKKNDIHIIDLSKTIKCLDTASKAMQKIIKSGKKILFVATKKQAKTTIKAMAEKLEQPYIVEKFLGGTLTNFATIRKSVKKIADIDTTMQLPNYKNLTKREQLIMLRKKSKLETILQGLSIINRLPAALFIVDVKKEQTAVKEAIKLGIPIFAIVDTNSSPTPIDYPIPANDDARSSIAIILDHLETQLQEALQAWKKTKKETELTPERIGATKNTPPTPKKRIKS